MESLRFVAPTEPIAPWLGGKRHLAQTLADLIAVIPHQTYIEPFMGMGGVFLRRRAIPPCEIINDINRELVTLFRVMQRHPVALEQQLLLWPLSSRDEFDRLKRIPPETMTDVERAARFLYLQRLAFGGRTPNPSFGVDLSAGTRLRIGAALRQIRQLRARLEGVVIDCLQWQEIIRRYDRPDSLFYLDPPYWGGETDYGGGIFGRGDYAEMATVLAGLKGRFILSINDVPEVRRIFEEFRLVEVEVPYSIGAGSGAGVAARELIVRDGKGDEVGPLFARS